MILYFEPLGMMVMKMNRAMFKWDKRVCRRSTKQLKAHYLLCDRERGWEECSIINVNAANEGMGIKFHTREKIDAGTTIFFKIFIYGELEPINIKGIVKWSKKEGKGFIGGVKLAGEKHRLAKLA